MREDDPEQLDLALVHSVLRGQIGAKAYPLLHCVCECKGLEVVIIECGGCGDIRHEPWAAVRGCSTCRYRLHTSSYRALASWIGRERASQRELRYLFESREELALVKAGFELQRLVATVEVLTEDTGTRSKISEAVPATR